MLAASALPLVSYFQVLGFEDFLGLLHRLFRRENVARPEVGRLKHRHELEKLRRAVDLSLTGSDFHDGLYLRIVGRQRVEEHDESKDQVDAAAATPYRARELAVRHRLIAIAQSKAALIKCPISI